MNITTNPDITECKLVEITIESRPGGGCRLWINTEAGCAMRVFQAGEVIIKDNRFSR